MGNVETEERCRFLIGAEHVTRRHHNTVFGGFDRYICSVEIFSRACPNEHPALWFAMYIKSKLFKFSDSLLARLE